MNKAKYHIEIIAIDVAKRMADIDENKQSIEAYFEVAYLFILAKFALKDQQSKLCDELLHEIIENE